MKYFVYRITAEPKSDTGKTYGYNDTYYIAAPDQKTADVTARSSGIKVLTVHPMFECIVVLNSMTVKKKVVKVVKKAIKKKMKRRIR